MRVTPITMVTGYLGSGKTTFLKNILSQKNVLGNIALIENEFAVSFGVENELFGSEGQLAWVYEFGNGCLCCSKKGEMAKALHEMADKGSFDHVIIETTGLSGAAGPFLDKELQTRFSFNGIITVVDAKNYLSHLPKELLTTSPSPSPTTAPPQGPELMSFYQGLRYKSEVVEQIAIADRILINKLDLVTKEELEKCKEFVRKLNPLADVQVSSFSSPPDLAGFLRINNSAEEHPLGEVFAAKDHDPSVQKIVAAVDGPLDLEAFKRWLPGLLHQEGSHVFRSKGLVHDGKRRLLVQGVHQDVSFQEMAPAGATSEPNVLVMIGTGLDEEEIRKEMALMLQV